jgi:hypothetical protein
MMHVGGGSGGHRIARAGVSLRIAHHADHVIERRFARRFDRSLSFGGCRKWRMRVRLINRYAANSSSSAFASFRSRVSNPSVNQR